jgi:Flp pilus assembly protein TadG
LKTRCRKRSTQGVALIETALVLPLLVLLMLNIVNLGMYLYAWITVDNAARAAAEYQVYNGVVLGFPAPPTFSDVQSVVTAEVSSLPNKAGVTLEICSIANGNTTCQGTGTAFAPPADPEPNTYRIYAAEIGYQFQPLFPGFTFPGAAGIQQQVTMRSME